MVSSVNRRVVRGILHACYQGVVSIPSTVELRCCFVANGSLLLDALPPCRILLVYELALYLVLTIAEGFLALMHRRLEK